MKTKDIVTIIHYLEDQEEVEKVLKKYNYESSLCIDALESYKGEEDKLTLAKKTKYDESFSAKIMTNLTTDVRRIFLLEQSNFNKIVCDAAMHSFDFNEGEKSYITEILEKVSYNENFKESLAEYLRKSKE